MDPITGLVASWLGEWATTAVAGALLSGVSQTLNPKALEKALQTASEAAREQSDALFFSCQPDGHTRADRVLLYRSITYIDKI